MTTSVRFGPLEVQQLLEIQDGPCVSIYLPLERLTAKSRQNEIKLKNMLREAENEAGQLFPHAFDAAPMLAPARKLLKDAEFWRAHSDCLALFISGKGMRTFRLPEIEVEFLFVGDKFHIKPLLSLVAEDSSFYLLAVSQKEVRFFAGSRQEIEQRSLPKVPGSVDEILTMYESRKQLQVHSGASGPGGLRSGVFHGHGGANDADEHKARLKEFFQQIDQAVSKLAGAAKAPLIFAGVEYLFPLYRSVNSYAGLCEEIISGNPEHLSAETLHKMAWRIIEQRIAAERQKAAERFQNLLFRKEASTDIREILPSAKAGRVDTLFVPVGHCRWGRFRAESAQVELHREKRTGDPDLLDLAAL
ncbi:MAG TPA: hypothetical protein PLP17_13425, partial [Oligoflexia bacterium]|nr:hypothetical protein [Oligoflexia bacterium]